MDYNYINYLLILMLTKNNHDFTFERVYKNLLSVSMICFTCDYGLDETDISSSDESTNVVTFRCPCCWEEMDCNPSHLFWSLVEP